MRCWSEEPNVWRGEAVDCAQRTARGASPVLSAGRCAELEEALAGGRGECLAVGVEEVQAARIERDPHGLVGLEARRSAARAP